VLSPFLIQGLAEGVMEKNLSPRFPFALWPRK